MRIDIDARLPLRTRWPLLCRRRGGKLRLAKSVPELGICVLSGQVDVYRLRSSRGEREHFATSFGPGSAAWRTGAQLAGRPSFFRRRRGPADLVKALIFSPDRIRALMIAEAELGGTGDARPLILRRTQMLQRPWSADR